MSLSNSYIIASVVGELVRMRRSFTGEDVYNRIHNKYIRRDEDYRGCSADAKQVSRSVRMMFNGKEDVFAEYGSTIVPDNTGPVVYFPLPHHAKVKVNKIKHLLAN